MEKHFKFMQLAFDQAKKAERLSEVPIGCVVVDEKGSVVAANHNQKVKSGCALDHAEMVAIREVSKLGDWRLNSYSLYVTLEPCPMCMAALVQARIGSLYFGAYDLKGGCLSLGYDIPHDRKQNHHFTVTGGILEEESSLLLSNFFKKRR